MKTKEPLLTTVCNDYPHWHHQPLRLTLSEMENPLEVVRYFFDCYTLPDMRECLQNWLEDSLSAIDVNAKDHLAICRDVERFVEATWLLYQQAPFDKGLTTLQRADTDVRASVHAHK